MNDCDIFWDQSQSDCDMRGAFYERYQEAFEANRKGGNEAYKAWWQKLSHRTDISDDDRWEIESEEDSFHKLVNIYTNLQKQGVLA